MNLYEAMVAAAAGALEDNGHNLSDGWEDLARIAVDAAIRTALLHPTTAGESGEQSDEQARAAETGDE